jgi:SpoVK/Ycf46/Vps4 family AAA+-type ATPase
MNSTVYIEPALPDTAPDTERLPDALFGGSEALEEINGEDSFWSRQHPRDVPFFKMALLDQLLRRPYHAVTLEGPFRVKQLAQDYRAQLFRSETSINRSGFPSIDRLLLVLGGGVFGYLDGDSFKLYAPTPQAAEAAAQKFRRYVKPQAASKPYFYIISLNPEGPRTETVSIERVAPVSTEELALNYGPDFPVWEAEWTERTRRTPSGLTILFGPPGTGKTSYLRALMARLLNQAVFYFVPLSEAEMLSSPRFVGFWAQQTTDHGKKQKIAILEDAEELLLARDAGSRDKVSNLLNIADGFLGDHLRLHVIATTNAPRCKLDPAIIRPGQIGRAHV